MIFLQLVAAFLLYQKEFLFPRLIALSFTEPPDYPGVFLIQKSRAAVKHAARPKFLSYRGGDLVELAADFYVLRAGFLALAAFYALVGARLAVAVDQPAELVLRGRLVAVERQHVHCGERAGNAYVLRAHLRAVVADGARNDRDLRHFRAGLFKRLALLIAQAAETLHV